MVDRVVPPRNPEDTAELDRFFRNAAREINVKECASQSDTTAADLAALKVDFNLLLAKLKTAHLMET